jgi:hypothetical protein
MEDTTHLQVYRRFFALLIVVLPGVVLCYSVAVGLMALFGDAIGLDSGWAIGFGAIGFAAIIVTWIFLGPLIERWAEEKPLGLLAGVATPLILITIGGMLGFYLYIEGLREERLLREAEERRRAMEGRAALVIDAPELDHAA